MTTDDSFLCPFDGTQLQSVTRHVNANTVYVHVDGATHGGLLEFAEIVERVMADLNARLAPLMAGIEAAASRGLSTLRAMEWPACPALPDRRD